MDMQILQYIIYGLGLLLGGLALWFKGNAKLTGKVAGLIADAEAAYKDATKAGGRKFEWVVDQLYSFIPAAVRPFVPRSTVEALVQTTFDAVQGYAKLQLDKLAERAEQGATE